MKGAYKESKLTGLKPKEPKAKDQVDARPRNTGQNTVINC